MEARSADREKSSFHLLLRFHLDRGTRPQGARGSLGMKWAIPKFAHAVGVAEHTVRDWLAAKYPPNESNFVSIEGTLFGQNHEYDEWRLELRQALTVARAQSASKSFSATPSASPVTEVSNWGSRPKSRQYIPTVEAASRLQRRHKRFDPTNPEPDEPAPSASAWESYGTRTLWPGLAELLVHLPPAQ